MRDFEGIGGVVQKIISVLRGAYKNFHLFPMVSFISKVFPGGSLFSVRRFLGPKRDPLERQLKADRPHPRYYPYMSPDYRHTDSRESTDKWTDGWTDRRTDATKCIISLASRSIKMSKVDPCVTQNFLSHPSKWRIPPDPKDLHYWP